MLQIPMLCKLQLRSTVSMLDRCGDESSLLRCQHAIMWHRWFYAMVADKCVVLASSFFPLKRTSEELLLVI
jgi:putative SOS response-associated peptidase YedK